MKYLKRISSVFMAILMAVSMFVIPVSADSPIDVKNSIKITGTIQNLGSSLDVVYVATAGITNTRGVLFNVELPEGVTLKGADAKIPGWTSYYNTTTNNVVIMVDVDASAKSIQEAYPGQANVKIATLNVAVNAGVAPSLKQIGVTVKNVNNGEAENSGNTKVNYDVAYQVTPAGFTVSPLLAKHVNNYKTQNPTITWGNTTLVNGVDYTLSYPAVGTLRITGKGVYTGYVDKKFSITTHNKATSKLTPATTSKNGVIKSYCSICNEQSDTQTIYAAKTVKLSSTEVTYNGKKRTPSVIVKDSKGKKISSKYYSVKYASGRKSVGKYSVKITFKGNYKGSKTLYLTINPKATKISKLSAAKKAFTVKWSKQSKHIDGYKIQYSTSSKFKKAKTVTVKSYKSSSKKISKLSGGKKYYVRVRTYNKVGSKTYYSDWSAKKSVKTKK